LVTQILFLADLYPIVGLISAATIWAGYNSILYMTTEPSVHPDRKTRGSIDPMKSLEKGVRWTDHQAFMRNMMPSDVQNAFFRLFHPSHAQYAGVIDESTKGALANPHQVAKELREKRNL
jgi:NADH-ubiquinone reductase complex 1 MLRQ subunit